VCVWDADAPKPGPEQHCYTLDELTGLLLLLLLLLLLCAAAAAAPSHMSLDRSDVQPEAATAILSVEDAHPACAATKRHVGEFEHGLA